MQINVRLDAEELEWVDKYADESGMGNRSAVVRFALKRLRESGSPSRSIPKPASSNSAKPSENSGTGSKDSDSRPDWKSQPGPKYRIKPEDCKHPPIVRKADGTCLGCGTVVSKR